MIYKTWALPACVRPGSRAPLVIPSAYAHFGVMARPVLLPVVGVVAAIYAASSREPSASSRERGVP